ncbi:hypothetical protein [Turneriella parva]|uniref:hypothetical protein n=1 Tax=Turneriella parva TaxID=29510 RepID=UPI0005A50DD4|nr:hypothetical protein [Turneriella parva]
MPFSPASDETFTQARGISWAQNLICISGTTENSQASQFSAKIAAKAAKRLLANFPSPQKSRAIGEQMFKF